MTDHLCTQGIVVHVIQEALFIDGQIPYSRWGKRGLVTGANEQGLTNELRNNVCRQTLLRSFQIGNTEIQKYCKPENGSSEY